MRVAAAPAASGPPPATCATSWPVREGDLGYPARCVETRLVQLGYWLIGPDNRFDHTGAHALRAFQQRHGLTTSGVADRVTLGALGVWSPQQLPPPPCHTHFPIAPGATGADVTCLERRLAQLGFSVGGPDRTFDATSQRSLRSFQYRNGLLATGTASTTTLRRLGIYTAYALPTFSTAPCATWWAVQVGSTGDPASCVERRLRQLGYWLNGPDGLFDATAANALRAFQRRHGLPATGWANAPTLKALAIWRPNFFPPATCGLHYEIGPSSGGAAVECLERRLSELGYWVIGPDHRWDWSTANALRAFQQRHGLRADGVARTHTLQRLGILDRTAAPLAYPAGWCDNLVFGLGDLRPLAGQVPVETRVIGHSVRGRPIVAEYWGRPNAARVILVVGQVHGNECSLLRLIQDLRAFPPDDVGMWLIPTLNPDGYVAGSRYNSNGVDLNTDGGRTSQPESRALMRFTEAIEPILTLHVHTPNGVVEPYGNSFGYHVARSISVASGLDYSIAPLRTQWWRWFLWQGQLARWTHGVALVELYAVSNVEVPNAQPRPPTRSLSAINTVVTAIVAAIARAV